MFSLQVYKSNMHYCLMCQIRLSIVCMQQVRIVEKLSYIIKLFAVVATITTTVTKELWYFMFNSWYSSDMPAYNHCSYHHTSSTLVFGS